MLINEKRVHLLNRHPGGSGPVIYWMSREQRVRDNWGLLHARELAGQDRPLLVVFCLVPAFLGATLRQYDFMLNGLMEVERDLKALDIPFRLQTGNPPDELIRLVREVEAGCVVTDFDPLRIKQEWQRKVGDAIPVTLIEVDGHNVIPARVVSDKQEYAARTIRPKLHRLTAEFFEDFPALSPLSRSYMTVAPVDWESVRKTIRVDESVGPVKTVAGEAAAGRALQDFIDHRLTNYAQDRNDPVKDATSRLSAYFHFGQLAPQRAALAVAGTGHGEDQEVFLEELIVRRELSDNFCLNNPTYDSLDGAPDWALKTLDEHRKDFRQHTYTTEQFDRAETHSELWNAAQHQLRESGFMHGYMRMYWAKKILEWSPSPEEAHATTIFLNDRYQLDGRDPNGYVGVLWSVAGLHDRPWKTRPVYGSVRYMNENGCRRKFDVKRYVERWLPK